MTAVPPQFSSAEPTPQAKNTRIVFNVERAIAVAEFNQLCAKVGQPPRDVRKLSIALEHSLFCVTARKVASRELVGYVRACGDGVFNAELLDMMAYPPGGSQEESVKKQLVLRFKREVRRTMPKCAISIFAWPADLVMLLRANFEKDPDGIRAMALPRGGWADEMPLYPGQSESLVASPGSGLAEIPRRNPPYQSSAEISGIDTPSFS
jgi:hypothetical protein